MIIFKLLPLFLWTVVYLPGCLLCTMSYSTIEVLFASDRICTMPFHVMQ